MVASDPKSGLYQDQANRLLARGGRILGLSAAAGARGPFSGRGSWFVLTPSIAAAADEILEVLQGDIDPTLLAAVLEASVDLRPATAAPSWARPLWQNPELFERVGRALAEAEEDQITREIFREEALAGEETLASHAQRRGIACVAVALGRSMDAVRSLALKLPESDGASLIRMGQLAQALVDPGEPSRMRAFLRQILKGEESGVG